MDNYSERFGFDENRSLFDRGLNFDPRARTFVPEHPDFQRADPNDLRTAAHPPRALVSRRCVKKSANSLTRPDRSSTIANDFTDAPGADRKAESTRDASDLTVPGWQPIVAAISVSLRST